MDHAWSPTTVFELFVRARSQLSPKSATNCYPTQGPSGGGKSHRRQCNGGAAALCHIVLPYAAYWYMMVVTAVPSQISRCERIPLNISCGRYKFLRTVCDIWFYRLSSDQPWVVSLRLIPLIYPHWPTTTQSISIQLYIDTIDMSYRYTVRYLISI